MTRLRNSGCSTATAHSCPLGFCILPVRSPPSGCSFAQSSLHHTGFLFVNGSLSTAGVLATVGSFLFFGVLSLYDSLLFLGLLHTGGSLSFGGFLGSDGSLPKAWDSSVDRFARIPWATPLWRLTLSAVLSASLVRSDHSDSSWCLARSYLPVCSPSLAHSRCLGYSRESIRSAASECSVVMTRSW